jgi:hypothetical protein
MAVCPALFEMPTPTACALSLACLRVGWVDSALGYTQKPRVNRGMRGRARI